MNPLVLQRLRWFTRTAFFVLFCVAPIFNLFRYDLSEGHFYLLTFHWSIGIGEELEIGQLALNLLAYGIFPIVVTIITGFWLFYKYGRLYCGWLCPHFSVVELNNYLFKRACGKQSIWDKQKLPEVQADGTVQKSDKRWWPLTFLTALSMGFIWAVVLITYVIDPIDIYSGLWNATLPKPHSIFIIVATIVLTLEFLFARHLFCRFGCAAGMFQSLAWMANRTALVINFNRKKMGQCKTCDNHCDHACPMRLKPRGKKRLMFSCTQCTQCMEACYIAQDGNSVLQWSPGDGDDSVAIPIKFKAQKPKN
jgi:polyferredoxin